MVADDGISDLFEKYDPGDLSDLTRVGKDLTALPKAEILGKTDDLIDVPEGLTKLSREDVIDGVEYEEDEMPGTPPAPEIPTRYRLASPQPRVIRRFIPPPSNLKGISQ